MEDRLRGYLSDNEVSEQFATFFSFRFLPISSKTCNILCNEYISIISPDLVIVIADDTAGGFFCMLENGKIAYISSSGEAGIVAHSLSDLIHLIVLYPNWNCYYLSERKTSGLDLLSDDNRDDYIDFIEQNCGHSFRKYRDCTISTLCLDQSFSVDSMLHCLNEYHFIVTYVKGNDTWHSSPL